MSISIHDIWLFCDHGKKVGNLPPSIIWLYPFDLHRVDRSIVGYNVWNILGPLGPIAKEEDSLDTLLAEIEAYKAKLKEELYEENVCVVALPSKASTKETHEHLDMALDDLAKGLVKMKNSHIPVFVDCSMWKEYGCYENKDKVKLRNSNILRKYYTVNIQPTDIGFLTSNILDEMSLLCTKNDCCTPYVKK